jgi:hypothetical protein
MTDKQLTSVEVTADGTVLFDGEPFPWSVYSLVASAEAGTPLPLVTIELRAGTVHIAARSWGRTPKPMNDDEPAPPDSAIKDMP